MKLKPAHVMALLILAGAATATIVSFSNSVAPYVTASEAMSHPGEMFQVQGTIVKSSEVYDPKKGELRFSLIDKHKQEMKVVYAQPKPENFDTAESVDAVGRYANGIFTADNLLVKCPSKYNDSKVVAPPKKI